LKPAKYCQAVRKASVHAINLYWNIDVRHCEFVPLLAIFDMSICSTPTSEALLNVGVRGHGERVLPSNRDKDSYRRIQGRGDPNNSRDLAAIVR
jgi:hypothetical protein